MELTFGPLLSARLGELLFKNFILTLENIKVKEYLFGINHIFIPSNI